MAEFKLGRIRFTWQGDWATATAYTKDDIVRYGGSSYVCLVGHTASTNFYDDLYHINTATQPDTDAPKWTLWFEGYEWTGDWNTGTFYQVGDIAKYGSIVYLCNESHTSTLSSKTLTVTNAFGTGTNVIPTTAMAGTGTIVTLTYAEQQNIPFYIGQSISVSGATPSAYNGSWTVTYASKTQVRFNSTAVGAQTVAGTITSTTGVVTLEFDPIPVAIGDPPIVPFLPGDSIVVAGVRSTVYNGTYTIRDCTSTSVTYLSINAAPFIPPFPSVVQGATEIRVTNVVGDGSQVTVTFAEQKVGDIPTAPFTIGQTVTLVGVNPPVYNGLRVVSACTPTTFIYTAITEVPFIPPAANAAYGTLVGPQLAVLEQDQEKWTAYAKTDNWLKDWLVDTRYRLNDVVKYNGILYRCIDNHTSAKTVALGLENDSSKWQLISFSEEWRTDWTPATRYRRNDIIRYGGIVYRCNSGHTSAATTALGLEIDFSSWQIVHSGIEYKGLWSTSFKYKLNDVVKYGANQWICFLGHISDPDEFEPSKWNLYIPGLEYKEQWTTLDNYIPGDVVKYGGYSYFSKTHNFNFAPSTHPEDWELLTKGFKIVGEYNTATQYFTGDVVRRFGKLFLALTDSQGSETTNGTNWELVVDGTYWKDKWDNNIQYYPGDVVNYIATTYRCVVQHLSALGNNPQNDVIGDYWITYAQGEKTNRLLKQGDILTYNNGSTVRYALDTVQGNILQVNSGLPSWEAWGEIDKVYYVATNGVDDTSHGSSLNSPWKTVSYACSQVTGPATIFIKTGIYYEALPISIPANVALCGDELRSTVIRPIPADVTKDMFYVRNGTGIRNMTLQGLTGTLSAPNQYGTRRPTAGSFVSLDPGAGPADSSVWITTKSCYVQNVTTFGTACIGLKIDGALHNGGNRSIVANDFTQVLSDGIACWCTNLGLTELVSVFSYYGHIGYLAENGGKIRATNGNSSYGTYGCVSEGVSASEIPITGTMNNRSTEAQIANVFIGEASDQILKLEYSNAGNSYSTATYTFTGSGTQALALSDEFRDGAVFEVRILQQTLFSGYGGTGYEIVSNNVQAGNTLTLTIASNDKNPEVKLLDKRIMITSGTGVGQYGYVAGLNFTSKVVSVAKESVDQLTATSTIGSSDVINVNNTTYFPAGTPVYFSYTTYVITISAAYGPSDVIGPGVTRPNQLTCNSTVDLVVGMPITFSSAYGTIGQSTVYYISEVVDSTRFKISATNGSLGIGATYTLSSQSGIVLGTVGGTLGGLQTSTLYYVLATNRTATQFQVSLAPGGTAVDITDMIGQMFVNAAGWDHINQGTPAVSLLDTTSVYSIEPRVTFSAPPYSSVASILPASVVWSAIAYGNGTFVTVSSSTNDVAASTTAGTTWVPSTMPTSDGWTAVAYGDPGWVAVGGTAMAASANGTSWSTIPGTPVGAWTAVHYGDGKYVAVGTNIVATSNNSVSWSSAVLTGTWTNIAYGKNIWVIVGTGTSVKYSTDNGGVWNTATVTSASWTSVTYGNGRFVAVATGGTAAMYSFNGATWYDSALPSSRAWNDVVYGQGLFIVVASSGNSAASSQDGLTWTARSLSASANWKSIAFGNPTVSSVITPKFVAVASSGTSARVISAGATALGRAVVDSNAIKTIKIWEPGSGYTTSPTVTVHDAVNTTDVLTLARVGNGVLGNPSFVNRGTGYRSSSTVCTIDGNGYADIYPVGKYVIVSNLSRVPGPGANLSIDGIPDIIYKIVKIFDLGSGNAKFQIAPYVKIFNSPVHGTGFIIREKYSQVRLTGHDFLLIGTGNFTDTNYPNTDVKELQQQAEIAEFGGGRCFYTSTDQDGNFRVGELFKVEQATGTVTISADFFQLKGLEELSLGGVSIGGSAVVVREFSTDQFFTADSNNVVPTQKAIKAYIAKRISGGGSDAQTGVLVAGIVKVGPQSISTTTNLQVYMKNKVKITKGIDGSMLAMTFFADSFSND
jgi:hypothetical protein